MESIRQEYSIPLKCYSNIQLATLYEVSPKTFRTWLKPFKSIIGKRIGIYYNINQVSIIFEKLGRPGRIILEE